MARGTETGYVYRSNVRSGCKREFEFAFNSHNTIPNSINTSRSRKRSKPGGTNPDQIRNLNEVAKATKTVGTKNDDSVVDVGDNKKKSGSRKLSGGKHSSVAKAKVVPKLRTKDLLKSGLLIGWRVHYRKRSKLKVQGDIGVYGYIRKSGIECHCDKCEGKNVVLPLTHFELHAGSLNKRPSDFIFLDDGRSLKMALKELRASQANSKATDNHIENVGQPVAPIAVAEENPSDGNINHILQTMVEKGEQQIPSEMLESIEKKLASKSRKKIISNVRWRILNGKMNDMERNESLFKNIISIFHGRFSQITMPGEKKSIIPDMVHGNVDLDKNYEGMHAAVLTLNSKVISALLFRVHGNDIVELPLAATSRLHEKKGYFRVLYLCFEEMLKKMDVEYVYLPAAHETKKMWIENFDFFELPDDKLEDMEKKYSLMSFDETSMLCKSITRRTKVDVTETST